MTLIPNSPPDVIEVCEKSSDAEDQQSEASIEDPSWLPSDPTISEDNRQRKSKRQRKRNALAPERGLRTRPVKRVKYPHTCAPKFARKELENGTSVHDRMQGKGGNNLPLSTAFQTSASTQLLHELTSTATTLQAVNLLQYGTESLTLGVSTEAFAGGVAAGVSPCSSSTIDQFGQAPASPNDEIEGFLTLLHRHHKRPLLHDDIVSAFDSISELVRNAINSFLKITGFHSVLTNSLSPKALDLCRVLVGGDEPENVRTRTATVSSQVVVSARDWIQACVFASIYQSVFVQWDTTPPVAIQEWIAPLLNSVREGKRPGIYMSPATRKSANDVKII